MDKNPKHPLKKKKAVSKINIADHEAVREARRSTQCKKTSLRINEKTCDFVAGLFLCEKTADIFYIQREKTGKETDYESHLDGT